MKSSLLARLGLIAAALVVGIAAIFLALVYAVRSAGDAVEETRRLEAVIASAVALERHALASQSGTRGYVITGSDAFLRPARLAELAYRRELAVLRQAAPEQRAALERLEREFDSFLREWQRPLVAAAARDPVEARRLVSSGDGQRRIEVLNGHIAAFVAAERQLDERVGAAAESRERLAELAAYGGLGAAVLLVLVALGYAWRSVVAPVRALAAVTHAVTAGDLGARASERGVGDVAELAADFNTMVAALERNRQELADHTRRLHEAQRLESLGVLAGGIAHDFNNLLTGVLGNASLLLQDASLRPELRSSIEQIELSATRAAELTTQMLAYSGKGRFVVRPLDLGTVVGEMAGLLAASIPKEVTLEQRLPPELPPIKADAAQIRQVLMNLIVNGAEALEGRPGVVVVRGEAVHADRALLDAYRYGDAAAEGDFVALEVEDTGSGMEEETLTRIFDPFFTTKFTGRGLGLAAVLGIVRGHGGALQIESEPGRGTTFRLLFPAAQEPAVREAPSAESGWRGEGVVLVADDEPVVRDLAVATLERAGFVVDAVADGAEAVAAVTARPDRYRIVLLDLTMPGMGGETALARIRWIRPELPIVIMSGYSEQDVANRFAGRGVASFVQKPFRPASLVAKVREVLEPLGAVAQRA